MVVPSHHISVYKVTRELKKEQQYIFNCLCSIAHDASFVQEVCVLVLACPAWWWW
jgi:hypothetical protein